MDLTNQFPASGGIRGPENLQIRLGETALYEIKDQLIVIDSNKFDGRQSTSELSKVPVVGTPFSGCHHQFCADPASGSFPKICSLLADNTECSPRDGRKPLRIDRIFAFGANSKRALTDPVQCILHLP
jgi:hypothetical protein